jgi:hypothetical protein
MGSRGKERTRQRDCGDQVWSAVLTLLYWVVHEGCQCATGGPQITLSEVP